jgi:hypothetical protein
MKYNTQMENENFLNEKSELYQRQTCLEVFSINYDLSGKLPMLMLSFIIPKYTQYTL